MSEQAMRHDNCQPCEPMKMPMGYCHECEGLKAAKFRKGDMVRKVSGSSWHGKIVGTYSTQLTPEGYAVESHFEPGSVQIYPAKALEAWRP